MNLDKYYAAGNLREASTFFLNMNFEILNGCKFKCEGCHVEKNAQNPIQDIEFENLNKVIASFRSGNYLPNFAFIGPTDFLTADNFSVIFSDPKFIHLFHQFRRISFQTTYLNINNAESFSQILKTHYSDMEIEIDIIIDAGKIADKRYLGIIEKNKKTFLDFMGMDNIRTFAIMNVYDYNNTQIPELLKTYDSIHKSVCHLFENTIDYNFSFMRSKDISKEEFVSLSGNVKNLFNTSMASKTKEVSLRFSFGKLADSLLEKHLNYRNGNLYYSPLLYERFVTFNERFKIPFKDFTAKEFEDYEFNAQLSQYSKVENKEECANCPLLASCIERGILFLMDHFESTKCPVAKESFFAANSFAIAPQTRSQA